MFCCPLCNNIKIKIVYKIKNRKFIHYPKKRRELSIAICGECSFVFQQSAFTEDFDYDIKKVNENYYKNNLFPFPYRNFENEMVIRILSKNYPKIKSSSINVLEIGSNRGDLLFILKEKFPLINVLGIEPAVFNDLQIPTIQALFSSSLFSSSFDIVILQQVLEHIKYPKNIIKEIKKILVPGGIVFIEVPNLYASVSNLLDDFCLEHINYFSSETLIEICDLLDVKDLVEDHFLRGVFVNAKDSVLKERKDIDRAKNSITSDMIHALKSKKEEIIEKIEKLVAKNRKIVFYGVGGYFSVLIDEFLDKGYKKKNMSFFDDNYKELIEPTHQLARINSFEDDMVVVLCSNNMHSQKKMIENLKKMSCKKEIIVVPPWRGFIVMKKGKRYVM